MNIEEYCQKTKAKIRNRTKHLSVEYVLKGLESLVSEAPDCSFVVKQSKFFRTGSEFDPDLDVLLFKHPSFRIRGGKILRYDNHRELRQDYDRTDSVERSSTGNVVIIYLSDTTKSQKLSLRPISELLDELYHLNIYPDIVASSAKKFVSLATEAQPNLNTEDLLKYLSSNYREVEGLSVLSYQIKRDKNERDKHLMHLDSVSDYGVSLTEITDELAETIRYCSEWRRLSVGFCQLDSGESVHFAVVPIGSSRFEFEPEAKLRDFAVVFSIDREFDEFLVRFLEFGISHIDQRVQFEAEAGAVSKLGALKRHLQSEVRNGNLRDEISRNEFVNPRLEAILADVRDQVGAHSLTVRVYDPFEDALKLYLETHLTDADYPIGATKAIPISMETSTNVNCFKNKRPEEHIYVPRIDNRDGDSEPGQERRFNPRRSECEVCFPIWKSGVPQGTLNVEAAAANSLGPYIQYLKWISMLISEISTEISDATPSDVIDLLSKVNDLAHGTLDADPMILESLMIGKTSNEISVVKAWQEYSLSYRRPVPIDEPNSLQGIDLESFINKELSGFFRAIEPMHAIGGEAFVPKAIVINSSEARNLKGILRSILSNAHKHAGPGLEGSSLRIFGLHRAGRACLFLRYSTLHRIVPSSILRILGTVPVVKDSGVRYGAFLMAQRIRASDGSLFIERPPRTAGKYGKLRLSVALPLSNNAED